MLHLVLMSLGRAALVVASLVPANFHACFCAWRRIAMLIWWLQVPRLPLLPPLARMLLQSQRCVDHRLLAASEDQWDSWAAPGHAHVREGGNALLSVGERVEGWGG